MDRTEFLLARIAEDEGWAREALALSSIYKPDSVSWHWIVAHEDGSRWLTTSHDPARVLAECEAKRKAIDAAWDDHVAIEGEWGSCRTREELKAQDDHPLVVQFLAAVYASHPDYREEWRR